METQLFVVFDTKPIPMVCLQCKESITTKIDAELGWLVWSAAGVLCLTGLWCFFCKKVTHSCLIYVNFRLQIGLINPYIRARISLIKVYDRAPIFLIHAYVGALENVFYGCGPAVALQDAGFSTDGHLGCHKVT